MKASYKKYTLEFKRPAGTSRGILKTKETFFLKIEQQGKSGIGECNCFRGLSADDKPNYEKQLAWTCNNISLGLETLLIENKAFPSIQFGLEQAFLDLESKSSILFPSEFTQGKKGIKTNGLIWMGDFDFMQQQIEQKLADNFDCIKLKIGAIKWKKERDLLENIRKKFPANVLELRVDANGGFSYDEAKTVLKELADLEIHSIEQPIKQKNIQQMTALCKTTPTPIALDEELIGVFDFQDKKQLLETIKPQYIILKPALVGGFSGSKEWIELAESLNIGWWITSALESNIGLNAIAQWTFTLNNPMPQGLGTGGLFTNNLPSNLYLASDELYYQSN